VRPRWRRGWRPAQIGRVPHVITVDDRLRRGRLLLPSHRGRRERRQYLSRYVLPERERQDDFTERSHSKAPECAWASLAGEDIEVLRRLGLGHQIGDGRRSVGLLTRQDVALGVEGERDGGMPEVTG
jgi:hypothetical protein